MKMKHWTYAGLFMIAGNVSLLGVVRAAEMSQGMGFYRQPRLPLSFHWNGFSRKPLQAILAPVAINLFAGQKVQALHITNLAGFLAADRKLQGPLLISLQKQKLTVYCQGKNVMVVTDLTLRSLDSQPFLLKVPGKGIKYTTGEVKLRIVKNRIQLINRLNIDEYVSGVLEGELGSLKLNREVLKAQAIVARSYVLAMRGQRHQREGFEFCDRPHCQVYGGIPQNNSSYLEMIDSVRGQYLSSGGKPIAAFYHHNCGGMTSRVEDVWPVGARSYLKAVAENPGSICRSSKAEWRYALKTRMLSACLRKAGRLEPGETVSSIQLLRKDASGRVRKIEMQTTKKSFPLSIDQFRHLINQYAGTEVLRSALFIIRSDREGFIVEGRGWGHGVGFCQEGAGQLARQGKTFQQILQHYYPNTQLAKLPSLDHNIKLK